MKEKLLQIIVEELKLKKSQVKGTVALLEEGNTVPFIARYRKEKTGKLDESEIRNVKERIEYLQKLEERKESVISLIDNQDRLTDEIKSKILSARSLQEVEDLYRPYKQKRQTRATKAKKKGLEPLAELIWEQELFAGDVNKIGGEYIDPDVELDTVEDVYRGARDIIAEWISDDPEIRKKIREFSFDSGCIQCKCKDEKLDEEDKYEMYYQYNEKIKKIPPHRTLAINRGEDEDVLQVKVEVDKFRVYDIIKKVVIESEKTIFYRQIIKALEDAYNRLISPSIEREIRNKMTDRAEEHAIKIFSSNLRSLLLQPPLTGHRVMGIDPAYRTGCKVCIVDEYGKLLQTDTIYPHPPQNKEEEGSRKVKELIKNYRVDSIAIGNGTASRETEFFIADIIKELNENNRKEISYVIVNEAGASVYSASGVARQEFPELDVAMRGAVSIARRLQDPLAELVKINPRSIGVGLYQHDINQKRLEESLTKVVESCVNYVGVNLNNASSSLLEYVAGINSSVARNIVEYREENDSFQTRKQLKKVSRLGPKTFTQSAGFLRIVGGKDVLANTPIHPESYRQTRALLADLGFSTEDINQEEGLTEIRRALNKIDVTEKAKELGIGEPTLRDIIGALKKPGRDLREELPAPVFRTDVLKIEDLEAEMVLKGTVNNVVDFGAFVDIGVKQDGLVHISEMSHDYIEDPLDVIRVGDVIDVRVLSVDKKKKRISLSMKL